MGDSPDDLGEVRSEMERLRAKAHRSRIAFLTTELALSSTFGSVAETEFRSGERDAAERALAHAETAYATLDRFMSDPKYADHLTEEEQREFTARMERLRSTLDNLRPAK